MKIYPGENVSGLVSNNRPKEAPKLSEGAQSRQASAAESADNPVPEIRKQLLVVQRSLGRLQSILSGFEGFRSLVNSGAAGEEAAHYINQVVYRGEAVLKPFSVELNRILEAGDGAAVQRLIENARSEINGLAVQLSRLETAEQNSRSIAASGTVFSDILEGIRSEGNQLLKLDGRNVLDLLG